MSEGKGFKARLKEKWMLMLSVDVPPRKLALSSGIGVCIGMSPFLGLHNYMALLIGGVIGLPLYPLMIGVNIFSPALPFIFVGGVKLGKWLLRSDIDVTVGFASLTFRKLLIAGKELFIPFILGTSIIAIVCGIVVYFLVYIVVVKYRAKGV